MSFDVQSDAFEWPSDPQEDWWLVTGSGYKLAPETIRFAAALFRLGGADAKKNSVAAKLAGLPISRTKAFRLARSVGVKRLLSEAEKVVVGARPPISELEIDRKIEDMILSPDARTSATGIELRQKRLDRRHRAAAEPTDPTQLYRDMICFIPVYGPAMAVGWFCAGGEGGWIGNFPFLKEVAPYLKAHFAGDWVRWRGKTTGDWQVEFLDRMESGPLLTPDELAAAVTVKRPAPKLNGARQAAPVEQEASYAG
jgi:hypothetical protein